MHLALDSLEREYLDHFDYIVILCPTLKHNEMYCKWKWSSTDSYIIPIVVANHPGNCFYDWIEKLSNLLAGWKTLFLIDDIIANEMLDKQRQPLLGLAIMGRKTQRSFSMAANAIQH